MRTHRLISMLALLALLLGGPLAAPPRAVAAQDGACFQETGFCIQGRFLDYWQANGGLARNGYPLTAERQELLEDGNTYTVQYFERVRLEYHPENQPPFDVLLGQFGRRVYKGQPANTPPAIDDRFGDYWQTNGGLVQRGVDSPVVSRRKSVP